MSPDIQAHDMQVRLAAMEFLRQIRLVHGETLPAAVLQKGFEFQGRRVPLIARGEQMTEPSLSGKEMLTRLSRRLYSLLRNNPGSFGEGARSRSERIGSCSFWEAPQ